VVFVIVLVEIVRIIRRDERYPHVVMHLEEFLVDDFLFLDPVSLDLEVVAVTEESLKILGHRPGLVPLSSENRSWHRSREAPGGANQSVVMFLEE